MSAAQIGLVINTADPYSVEVGAHYIAARRLQPAQVLKIDLPSREVLEVEEFEALSEAVTLRFGAQIQAVALAWRQPYAVSCNSLTSALTLGFDGGLCSNTCAPSRPSVYFNSPSVRPYSDLRLRPSMLLAAKNVQAAKAMIDRGVAADGTLAVPGRAPAQLRYLVTSDRARSARALQFPPSGTVSGAGLEVHVEHSNAIVDVDRLLLYQTGLPQVPYLHTLRWLPGAVGDHLTSYGGRLNGAGGQMNALAWIGSGATGSYGTVSEPCSHPQKFPHPQLFPLHYAQGASLIEAYWKSVAWPQQGVFIGEPLASPFRLRSAR